MIARLKSWFLDLPARQQLLLLGAALLLLFWLLLQLVWLPMASESDRLRKRNRDSAETLVWMQQAADEIRRLRASGGEQKRVRGGPMSGLINSAAQAHGLLINRLQPSGDNEARVTVEDASFERVMAWMQQLESSAGIKARSLTISAAGSEGRVNIQGLLTRGA